MASNLRSKPISGHVTDNAGNVVSNSPVSVIASTPSGDHIVSSVMTNGDGYFVSDPVPSGQYLINSAGVTISSITHVADASSIQVVNAANENVGGSQVDFRTLILNKTPNAYRVYVQIELNSVNVAKFGNSYPIYDVDISGSAIKWYRDLSNFHVLNQDSRITTTRFDIEYYSPITEYSKKYKRIRWSGVPAIRYGNSTRLVIPLDYYSIVPNNPRHVGGDTEGVSSIDIVSTTGDIVSARGLDTSATTTGDIVRLEYKDPVTDTLTSWYGINIGESRNTVTLKGWKSSRVNSASVIPNGTTNIRAYIYDGMFSGLSLINSAANEYITVTENTSAQNSLEEVYSYEKQ